MTGGFDVTPKTTEQNLTVRIGKSEAEVTNNKRLRWRYCMHLKLTTDRHEASCGLPVTAELLVLFRTLHLGLASRDSFKTPSADYT